MVKAWAGHEETFLQRGQTRGQQAHGKHQENANQNHHGKSPHTCTDGCHREDQNHQVLAQM